MNIMLDRVLPARSEKETIRPPAYAPGVKAVLALAELAEVGSVAQLMAAKGYVGCEVYWDLIGPLLNRPRRPK